MLAVTNNELANLEIALLVRELNPQQRVVLRMSDAHLAQTLRDRLWNEHRIEAPIIERPDGLLLRVSTHFYTTREEIDRLAGALPSLLR